MSKVVVPEFITLDGVFQDPGGAGEIDGGGWAFRFERGPEGDRFKLDEVMAAGAMLLGRVTYEGFAEAWPTMSRDEAGFADRMNSMPKHVVSTTLKHAGWNNSTVIRGDLTEAVGRLREEVDGDILVNGSGQAPLRRVSEAGNAASAHHDQVRGLCDTHLREAPNLSQDSHTGVTLWRSKSAGEDHRLWA
jgi:dihydrofolate reductase